MVMSGVTPPKQFGVGIWIFSINLGEFITINPSSTGLHLAYKTLPNHPATPTPPHLIMSPFLVYLSSIHQISHWKHVSSTMWTFPYDPEESANQEPMAYISQLSQEVSEWSISLIFPFIYIS